MKCVCLVFQLDGGEKPQCKYLSEYFAFLFEFAKMGEEEGLFMLHSATISTMIAFFMGHKMQENYVSTIFLGGGCLYSVYVNSII